MKSKVDSNADAFNSVFCFQLEQLHFDAYILTGSSELACECIVEAHESLRDSFIASAEFATSAARLATIKSGLRKVASDIRHHALFEMHGARGADELQLSLPAFRLEEMCRERFLDALLQLNDFHRAVLLLRVYEQYSLYAVGLLLRLPTSIVKKGLADAIASLVASIHTADLQYRVHEPLGVSETLVAVNA